MKHKNFILRVVNLLFIAVLLAQYQHIAVARAAAAAERQQQIAEVENWNASVLQAEQAEEAPAKNRYKDGTYEGVGLGFGDDITVSVTIQDGKMTDISVIRADGEDKPYYKQALSVLDAMLSAQSTDVDTVSGATLTAEGLIKAVADALGKAAA